jgi:NadR type nicotinamide-nucleotide adenylyltransferase
LKLLKRVSITGPECTGKSWLAKKLAEFYRTSWVPEYSVEYLQKKGGAYTVDDILQIVRGQLLAEEKIAKSASSILFCDTDVLVNKIWVEVVFKKVPGYIEKKLIEHKYDIYLLCAPDIPWQPGPFRENPQDRWKLFHKYEDELKKHRFKYRIVTGDGDERFQNAVNFVEDILT